MRALQTLSFISHRYTSVKLLRRYNTFSLAPKKMQKDFEDLKTLVHLVEKLKRDLHDLVEVSENINDVDHLLVEPLIQISQPVLKLAKALEEIDAHVTTYNSVIEPNKELFQNWRTLDNMQRGLLLQELGRKKFEEFQKEHQLSNK